LCNTEKGRLFLPTAGNARVNGVPRSGVPEVAGHMAMREAVVG